MADLKALLRDGPALFETHERQVTHRAADQLLAALGGIPDLLSGYSERLGPATAALEETLATARSA